MSGERYMTYSVGEEVRSFHTGEFGYVREVDESSGEYLVEFEGHEEWLKEDELS